MRADVSPESAAETCPHCGRPFPDEQLLLLHEGRDHERSLTDAELTAVRDAQQREAEQLRIFQLKALLGLILLYFGFVIVYAVFT